MSDSAGIRQRNTATTKPAPAGTGSSSTTKDSAPTQAITILDLLRVALGLVLISTLGSYLITPQKSLIWGFQQPWFTRPDRISLWLRGPLELTNAELAAYDGSDPDKPVLLALNRTIYDVSASRRIYGPGGPYSALAAKDASRSYVTQCFDPKDDLVPYLGGAEEVYVPLWLSKKPGQAELDAIAQGEVINGMGVEGLMALLKQRIGRKKFNKMQADAYEEAKDRVRAQVRTWEGMFTKKDYPVVGRVVGVDDDDVKNWASLKFCETALKQRPSLADSLGRALEALGHEGGKLDIGKMQKSGAGGDTVEKLKKAFGAEAEKARAKRDAEGKDGKQARDEAKAEQKVEDAAHEAVIGDDKDGTVDDKAKASIEDMMKGGKFHSSEKEKQDRKAAIKAARERQQAEKDAGA